MSEFTPDEQADIKMRLRAKVPEFSSRIAPVYVLLGWEWTTRYDGLGLDQQDNYVPTVYSIRNRLYSMISELGGDEQFSNTGGLEVYQQRCPSGEIECGLRFVDDLDASGD